MKSFFFPLSSALFLAFLSLGFVSCGLAEKEQAEAQQASTGPSFAANTGDFMIPDETNFAEVIKAYEERLAAYRSDSSKHPGQILGVVSATPNWDGPLPSEVSAPRAAVKRLGVDPRLPGGVVVPPQVGGNFVPPVIQPPWPAAGNNGVGLPLGQFPCVQFGIGGVCVRQLADVCWVRSSSGRVCQARRIHGFIIYCPDGHPPGTGDIPGESSRQWYCQPRGY